MIDEHDEGEGKKSNVPIFFLGVIIFFLIIIAMAKVYRGEGMAYVAPDPPTPEHSHVEEW